MATSNHERVGKALDLLREGLRPFVEREMKAHYDRQWQYEAANALRQDSPRFGESGDLHLDVAALLTIVWFRWNEVFKEILGPTERSYVSELRDVRNRWAHQVSFTSDDAYRALDSIARLLVAISAEQATQVEQQKQELLRQRFDEQTRKESRQAASLATAGQPQAGLRPWREVVTPHPDVASGRYLQAEFAADLAQVYRGEGSSEYRDPREFFQRTFLTDGLRHLLAGALRRLGRGDGDPVVELQTNFGGGKTHSMLGLYHLFSGTPAAELAGVESVLKEVGVDQPPATRRAVLVGTALSPAASRRKPDGTEVRTLWGEMAWQLGQAAGDGREGYAYVASEDSHGVSPGSDTLADLFARYAPCLILVDEWVAFVRQLYKKDGLAAGSFDANMTFAQALTESAKRAPKTLVVASIPASQIEIGGDGGQAALERLKNVFERVESPWRPASAEESYEIVRRRLIQPMTDQASFSARDAVVSAFGDLYRGQPDEFPSGCREAAYERRLRDSYPIHPELFDRLYQDWSSLDRFQRTRGVLRLMAAVIHTLWERQDSSLLILPGSIPIDAQSVQFELTRYLDETWVPVIEKDVDGPNSLPLELDRQNPNLGRYSASRRVTRTLYLGSAPTLQLPNHGLEDRQVKLGCAQPGETVATFGDALRRLTDNATYLYVNGRRYWLSTQPSVGRLAKDRADQSDPDVIAEEIRKRLRSEASTRGDFARVHVCPPSNADVPDDRDAKLVVLGPEHPHAAKTESTKARVAAQAFLDQRGQSPRIYRNTVVFLAPDKTRLAELEASVRQYLAWKSIEEDRETLNLDAFQSNQAKTKRVQWEDTIKQRIPETYHWLLVPGQPDPSGGLEWSELRLQGDEALALRASRKLRNDGLINTLFGATLLRLELDRVPLWRGDDVSVKQLLEDFAQYPYLPRLKNDDVLLEAVRQGPALLTWETEGFAYAEGWDESQRRYRALRTGSLGSVVADSHSRVVKSEIARHQLDAEALPPSPPPGPTNGGGGVRPPIVTPTPPPPPVHSSPRRFHGSVTLDSTRVGRDAGKIAEEVIQHLTALVSSDVIVTIEIEAEVPSGVPENVVRTVSENCRTLRFRSHEFEES